MYGVPLLMLDLDNTLVDRFAAFGRWAEDFVRDHSASEADLDWLIEADRDGFEARESLAALIGNHFGLTDTGAILEELRLGMVDRLELDPAVPAALDRARNAGSSLVVVTNGTVAQQERKLRRTGLDAYVDGWVISEGLGIRKPDPRAFAAAATLAGHELAGSWMIGDSATHDIVGAHAAGAQSIWLRRGRDWPAELEPPTHSVDTVTEAIDLILAANR